MQVKCHGWWQKYKNLAIWRPVNKNKMTGNKRHGHSESDEWVLNGADLPRTIDMLYFPRWILPYYIWPARKTVLKVGIVK